MEYVTLHHDSNLKIYAIMKRQNLCWMLTGILMSACAGNADKSDTTVESADNAAEIETVKLTPSDITIGGVKFTKSKNAEAGTLTLNGDTLKFVAGPQTDYFLSPDGSVVNSSPVIFTEVDNTKPFTFTAKVNPQFTETGTYSAGVLYAYENDTHSQKMCFEQDEFGDHRVVTVRTIGTSDDNNHQSIPGNEVYLRLSSDGKILGSYYSIDGKEWRMARLYKNDFPDTLLLGISSQSPKDDEHVCYFTEVSLSDKPVADFRNGALPQ